MKINQYLAAAGAVLIGLNTSLTAFAAPRHINSYGVVTSTELEHKERDT